MTKLRMFDVDATVTGQGNIRETPKNYKFEISAGSFGEAIQKGRVVALEQYFENGGQSDDPQVTSLRVDDESIN